MFCTHGPQPASTLARMEALVALGQPQHPQHLHRTIPLPHPLPSRANQADLLPLHAPWALVHDENHHLALLNLDDHQAHPLIPPRKDTRFSLPHPLLFHRPDPDHLFILWHDLSSPGDYAVQKVTWHGPSAPQVATLPWQSVASRSPIALRPPGTHLLCLYRPAAQDLARRPSILRLCPLADDRASPPTPRTAWAFPDLPSYLPAWVFEDAHNERLHLLPEPLHLLQTAGPAPVLVTWSGRSRTLHALLVVGDRPRLALLTPLGPEPFWASRFALHPVPAPGASPWLALQMTPPGARESDGTPPFGLLLLPRSPHPQTAYLLPAPRWQNTLPLPLIPLLAPRPHTLHVYWVPRYAGTTEPEDPPGDLFPYYYHDTLGPDGRGLRELRRLGPEEARSLAMLPLSTKPRMGWPGPNQVLWPHMHLERISGQKRQAHLVLLSETALREQGRRQHVEELRLVGQPLTWLPGEPLNLQTG